MILIPFKEIFSEIAEKDMRCFHVSNVNGDSETPPEGTYSLIELYCPDLDCDCREVDIVFVSNENGNEYATIQFGWEDKAFYDDFFGFDDHGLPGPNYAPMLFIGKYTNFFLDKFEELCATDRNYISTLETHYSMIKEKAQTCDLFKQVRRNVAERKIYRKPENVPKRNDQCPCGSGNKYKKCCLKVNAHPIPST